MESILLISMPGGMEWLIILLVVLLIFGGKKLPGLMKGMGKGIRGFKEEMKGDTSKDSNKDLEE